jgi:hypothetical protein
MSSAEIRHILTSYAKAWEAGDVTTMFAFYADDFTLHYGGRNALTGVHRGKPAALKALGEFSQRTRRRLIRVVDIMVGEERGGLLVREAVGPDGAEVERLFVYSARDGKLDECWAYDAEQPLIDRLVGA